MKSTVILLTSNGVGNGPDDLILTLAVNYFALLKDEINLPAAILFYGEGVKLVCEGSLILNSLSYMENKGVKLIACKTCLNYFGISEKIKAGHIGTMADILSYQLGAGKVISV